MSKKPKVKVATIWLSGCSGCHMSFLDLDERLIDLIKLVEITASPITDLKEIPPVDVGIVEGCVNNNEQEHHLRDLRAKCQILVALGDCAVTGNVPALRNQFPRQAMNEIAKSPRLRYRRTFGADHHDVHETVPLLCS